jgi:transcription termination/antitermination protein NusG
MSDKKWYIVHTYSGHEAKVKQSLLERAKSFHHEPDFDEILIPEENVVEVVKGERRTSKRKFFPGYILAKMTAQMKEGTSKPKPKIVFEEGEGVRVVSGPFANFSGFVDQVHPDKEKVRVMVQVFGRATPVMLDYVAVEKA